MVPILWGYSDLTIEMQQAVGEGRVLLGLNRRYCTTVKTDQPEPVLLLERSRLPTWACLDCKPRWLELHRFAFKQWEADDAKRAACDIGDYERAAVLFHRQKEIERLQGLQILALLRELAGGAETLHSENPS